MGARLLWIVVFAACGPANRAAPDAPPCGTSCAADGRSIIDCNGDLVEACDATEVCDGATVTCANACERAVEDQRSIGCEYYATSMDVFQHGECFAAMVANTWPEPAHITVRRAGVDLPIASFARIPRGTGAVVYEPYDPIVGLPPGEAAVLFLAGAPGADVPCVVSPALEVASFAGTGIGDAFEITSDVPVVAYQMNPYGGGAASLTTGASLLLPTSVWDLDYIAVNAAPEGRSLFAPSLNIVAREDNTIATITPVAPIVGGNGVPASTTGAPVNITLQKGQHAQITQQAELTGSVIRSNKPVGFMAGQPCMDIPGDVRFCDHGEQMIPPVRALGRRYVAASYRPRTAMETTTFWRVVGVVDGTQLSYTASASVGGPNTLQRGQSVTFESSVPFVVTSQDDAHPFLLFGYMSGATHVGDGGFGDPDFALVIPPDQYLDRYVVFADPTYAETNLVLIRSRSNGEFHDVTLDCAGVLGGWQPIGTDHEFTRVDLVTGFAPVGNCSTGRRELTSDAPFGVWIWGWGSSATGTPNVSYAYPGGMNVQPINNVIL
jgi:hypothetical protein